MDDEYRRICWPLCSVSGRLDLLFFWQQAANRGSTPVALSLWTKWYAGRKMGVSDECDEVALARLKRALSDLQYTVLDRSSGVGGSQDIRKWTVLGPGGQLKIESETFVGLYVEGSSSMVAKLHAQFDKTIRNF